MMHLFIFSTTYLLGDMKTELTIYIAPYGDDSNDGLSCSIGDNSTGPLASIEKAFKLVSSLTTVDTKSVKIVCKNGRYFFDKPLVLTGVNVRVPVTVTAADGETVVFDGGIEIKNWQSREKDGLHYWEAPIPESFSTYSDINQLFVNGNRALRPRYPENGMLEIIDSMSDEEDKGWKAQNGSSCVKFAKDDLKQFHNLQDVDFVALHYWIEEHLRIKSIDEEKQVVEFVYPSYKPLAGSWSDAKCPYYLENVYENFNKPGQFYVDGSEGTIKYIPSDGDDIQTAEVIVPAIPQLICIIGEASDDRNISQLNFENINFEHTLNLWPGDSRFQSGDIKKASYVWCRNTGAVGQGDVDVPGVIYMKGADNCSIDNCTFSGIGWYAVEIEAGCTNIRLVGNEVKDSLAGGFKINGADADGDENLRTGDIIITDNYIHDIGLYYHCSIGIIARHVYNTLISHNTIHDLYYTAVSVGWVWGYKPSVCKNNIIEYNHLYNIGKGLLSDMGGIYTLGTQPGSIIRNNLIHDIDSAAYGGWGIYPDEGTSYITIENNVVYSCNCSAFHQHYGKENMVSNNIFAFGDESIVALSRQEDHLSFTLTRNILLSDDRPVYCEGYGFAVDNTDIQPIDSSSNLIWDISGEVNIARRKSGTADVVQSAGAKPAFYMEKWQHMGYDRKSIVADPEFSDPKNGDFSFPEDSPAYKIGFKPIDLSNVGVRKQKQ
jgi:hypothetical protein